MSTDESDIEHSDPGDDDYVPSDAEALQKIMVEQQKQETSSTKVRIVKRLLPVKRRTPHTPFNRYALMSIFRNTVVAHRFGKAMQVFELLTNDRRCSHDLIRRAAFLLLERSIDCDEDCEPQSNLNFIGEKFNLFLKFMRTLDINKRELVLEAMMLSLRRNHYKDAIDYFDERNITRNMYRSNIVIDTLLTCYRYYIDYIRWISGETKSPSKAPDYFRQELLEKQEHTAAKHMVNLDLFVYTLIKILLRLKRFNDAYVFLNEYITKNENNVTAFIILYQLVSKFELYYERNILEKCALRVSILSPSHPIIINFNQHVSRGEFENDSNLVHLKKIMNFLDFKANKNDVKSWQLLVQRAKYALNNDQLSYAAFITYYNEFSASYWRKYHFIVKYATKEQQTLVYYKILFCSIVNDCHKYVAKAKTLLSTDVISRVDLELTSIKSSVTRQTVQ